MGSARGLGPPPPHRHPTPHPPPPTSIGASRTRLALERWHWRQERRDVEKAAATSTSTGDQSPEPAGGESPRERRRGRSTTARKGRGAGISVAMSPGRVQNHGPCIQFIIPALAGRGPPDPIVRVPTLVPHNTRMLRWNLKPRRPQQSRGRRWYLTRRSASTQGRPTGHELGGFFGAGSVEVIGRRPSQDGR